VSTERTDVRLEEGKPRFKVGDVVVLLSGGPQMTVHRVLDETAGGVLDVYYFKPSGDLIITCVHQVVVQKLPSSVPDLQVISDMALHDGVEFERARCLRIFNEGADLSIDALIAQIRSGQ
jgi:uncharacterized protein YodC (DUF2158 family)